VVIGHPQTEDQLFDRAVYDRGAMTLHALRVAVGDERFFRLLRVWFRRQGGGHVTVERFIATAERVTGMQLDALFQTWLYTPSKPPGIEPAARGLLGGRAAALLPPRFLKR
jgi:aminopeptidase N